MTHHEYLAERRAQWLYFPLAFPKTRAMRGGAAPKLGQLTNEILDNILGCKTEGVPGLIDKIGKPA